MRSFKPALIAFACALSLSSAQAVQTVDVGAFTVEYDETTAFGQIAFTSGSTGFEAFGWNLSPSIQAVSIGGANAAGSFAMPWFRVTVNPGYVLSGGVEGFLGNLVYNLVGDGAQVSASVGGTLSVNGGSAIPLGGSLDFTETVAGTGFSSGYLSGLQSINAGAISSFEFSGGLLSLLASGGSFASIIAQPQNELRVQFAVAQIPEPASWALMLGGLGVCGALARRRQARG